MRIPPPNRRVLTWFAALQLTVVVAGFGWEVHQLGWSDREAVDRVAGEVKTSFATIVASLDATTADLAARHDQVSRATTDLAASRELFAVLASRVDGDGAVTIYSAQNTPLAWAGRPSDLGWLRARVSGPAAMFVAPGPSGKRIVKVQPITEQVAGPTRRIGTIVSERDLPSAAATGPTADALLWPSPLVPVHIRTRYEGAGESRVPNAFLLASASGEPLLEGTVLAADVASARARLRRTTGAAAVGLCALLCAWLALPLMARSARSRSGLVAATCLVGAACAVVGSRVLARVAAGLAAIAPTLDVTGIGVGAASAYLATPVDLLATAMAIVALVAIAGESVTRLRIASRHHRRVVRPGTTSFALFVVSLCGTSTLVTTLLAKYDAVLHELAKVPGLDLLSFSVRPWDPRRLAVSIAVLGLHAAVVWGAVTLLRLGLLWFNPGKSLPVRAAWTVCWLGPLVIWVVATRMTPTDTPGWTIVPPAVLAIVLAWGSVRFAHWRRRASQSASMFALFLALALPSFALYPAAFVHATSANHSVVETQLALQVMRQRDDTKLRVRLAETQIDRVPGLAELAAAPAPPRTGSPPTESAFLIWSQTDLGAYRLTSAVELYSADGTLVSRFALNLPEYTSSQEKWQEPSCQWDMVEEVSPFGSEERRLLHDGRALCVDGPAGRRMVGAIVVHAMLDYGALPFLSSQNPYVEFFRNVPNAGPASSQARETEFAVYGWSRRPLYESASGASTLDEETFRRVYASRTPFWIRQTSAAGRSYDVFLSNDRAGIYALRLPTLDDVGHLVVLAELATLAGAVYVLWLLLGAFASALGLSTTDRGRDLFNEIRVSFYRKLAIAIVAAAAVPVLFLAALAQNYMAGQLRAGIEDAAIQTVTVAQRVVEDYGRLQERADSPGQPLTDDIMVWISRVIDQDVNVYDGALLAATSERDLFASGLLPTRTSANVFRAIALDRRATFVGDERAGSFSYLVAAAPARLSGHEVILTVPLTLRQQAIEREIDDLNRRILLAVVLFVVLGSALGWWMAERIADPVRALQRATRRLSEGDLDVRLVMTSSNELSRLVDAFNAMAVDLKRHQESAERTHKLEAWADMARQVAHEIKNPLTPIQLSAEHLRRVHQDQGSPLGPVVESCIDSILTQVRLLRQIAGDFSSFASSPTPRPVPITPADLVAEVIAPYRVGLPAGIHLTVDVPLALPSIAVDRSLFGRALANVVENALHAMPGGGSLTIGARLSTDGHRLEFTFRDTGVGMERSALGRIFEPYFSTKAIGTGLGLTIVKRNVELHGGTVAIESEAGVGTVVTLSLPISDVTTTEAPPVGGNP